MQFCANQDANITHGNVINYKCLAYFMALIVPIYNMYYTHIYSLLHPTKCIYVHISFVIKVIKKKLQDQVIFFGHCPLNSKLIKSENFWLITNFSYSLLYTIIAIVLKPNLE